MSAENAGLLWRQTHAGEVKALPLHRFLGLRLREEAEPAAGVTLAVAEASSATTGLHGGVLGVVLDVAATLALMPLLSVHEVPVTIAETVALISGAGLGDRIDVEGRVLRRSRHVALLSAVARRGDELIAEAQITKSIKSW